MIKQLQLRGISRTPSDRATADGGCAESLNVHLDQQETAPTLAPQDISEDIYGSNTRYPIVFIHKMAGVINYIGYEPTNRSFAAYGATLTDGIDTMGNATMSAGETFRHAVSLGNTIIVYSSAKPYYFIFKDNAYNFLGNAIPRPAVEVVAVPSPAQQWTFLPDGHLKDPSVSWSDALKVDDENHDSLLETITMLWDSVSRQIDENRTDGIFCAPFFIRYALHLKDDRYIFASSPILCGGGSSVDWMSAWVEDSITPLFEMKQVRASLNNRFNLYLRCGYNVGDWKDIVKSIDFFASAPVYAPNFNSRLASLTGGTSLLIFEGMDSANRDKTIKDEVLSKGQFYMVASFDVNDQAKMQRLSQGTARIEASEATNGDLLYTNDELVDEYRSGIQYLPIEGVHNYNSRIMMSGADELLTRGEMGLNGQVAALESDPNPGLNMYRYLFRYKVVDRATGKAHYVLGNYRDGTNIIFPAGFTTRGNSIYYGNSIPSAGPYFPALPYAWISYPDTRCTEVEVYFYTSYGYSDGWIIPMQQHPLLECAYAFLGFGNSLLSIRYNSDYTSIPSLMTAENRVLSSPNKIFLSEFENPFIFPAGNIVTFSDKVVGAATTSVPLSEGQTVGEFTMYVFTEGGMRVLGVNSVGTFSANMVHPNLSRHVALPGTILSLEQAVIFTTERGVMMLSGREVQELSRSMNGTPYAISGELLSKLQTSGWASLMFAAVQTDTFMEFMREARPAYDHNGARLIFFHPTEGYQYAYMIETGTWHKMYYGPIDAATVLNSYPDCLIARREHNAPANTPEVLDFSTVLSDADILEGDPVKGIIVTRPFDLGESDVRKSIRDIRIRGDFNRGDVQYILLGSFDGHSWKRLTSLRGGSYKLYRLVLLTNLSPMERITWIDVDYETRFTNRLR